MSEAVSDLELEAARALHARLSAFYETHEWTRGALARDMNGWTVDTTSAFACKYCALGALYRMHDLHNAQAYDQLPAAERAGMLAVHRMLALYPLTAGGKVTLASFNDSCHDKDGFLTKLGLIIRAAAGERV